MSTRSLQVCYDAVLDQLSDLSDAQLDKLSSLTVFEIMDRETMQDPEGEDEDA